MPAAPETSANHFPFLRLFVALTAGIIIEWYKQVSIPAVIVLSVIDIALIISFYILPSSKKFRFNWLQGTLFLLIFFCLGMFVTWRQNIQNDKSWYGKVYNPQSTALITIDEPLVEKTNSYKALGTISAVYIKNKWFASTGKVLLYFKKDSHLSTLQYGSEIIINKPIQSIKNSGNPAAFDYDRYCLFQNITGQTFLSSNDFIKLYDNNQNVFQRVLFSVRDWALKILKQNIHAPKESGIAEALLIGYRNDLDKDLVKAYSNTGVVHIIAISGLHIGVIYGALTMFFSLFRSSKAKKIIQPIVILLVIWFFTLVAGAAPSVLRAAVMFSFILAGKSLGKNGNIYNTLAASAFTLLIINPFYLWDVGFQLSYAAVISIVIFFKSINSLLYFRNRLLRWIWQLCAVSLAAQVFTLPLVVYHFHQLPLLFLFSNLLAVPLSGIILFEELLLFCISWWHSAVSFIGMITEVSIRWMNDFIEHIDKLSFSVWDGLNISILQLLVSFVCIAFLSSWIFSKKAKHLLTALSFVLMFFILRDVDIITHQFQQKIIVYNVPKQRAIDIIAGKTCRFAGDSIVLKDVFLRNFNLKSSRIKSRAYSVSDILLPDIENLVININSSKILLLGNTRLPNLTQQKIKLDAIILSQDFNHSPEEINNVFQCNYIIADGSVPSWKYAKWKKEFEQLHLRFYSVAQNGAFTLKL